MLTPFNYLRIQMADTPETQGPRYSTNFPHGYGNFEVISSDNVIFSFPRGVLEHVSPVFKDMFAIGITEELNREGPLPLVEHAETIEGFLLYIDPLKDTPDFTIDSAVSLVEAATKYQVPRMVDAFEKWAKKTKSGCAAMKTEPALFLSIAERFCLPEIGATAMASIAKADKTCVSLSKYPLTTMTIVQIMEVRAKRAHYLVEELEKFIKSKIPDIKPKQQNPRNQEPAMGSQFCLVCFKALHDLLIRTVIRLQEDPSWSSFLSEGSNRVGLDCRGCGTNLWSEICYKRSNLLSNLLASPDWVAFDRVEAQVRAVEVAPIPLRSLTRT
jgi:hypothetical protein